jgi:hypothetical protein
MSPSWEDQVNTDCLFQKLGDNGNYSGPCELVLDVPSGIVRGTATVRVANNSQSEAEVAVEEFQVPTEYEDNLLAFLNASPPRREGERTVVSIPANTGERHLTSFTFETKTGTFSASSGLLSTPALWGFGSNGISLVLNDLTFRPRHDKAAKHWLMPLYGPFGNHYLRRAAKQHLLAVDGTDFISFAADGLDCGLQVFDPEKKPVHAIATYDAIAFGGLRGSPSTLEQAWGAIPSGMVEALSFAAGADVTAPWIELRGDDGSLVRRFFSRIGHRSTEDGFAAFSKVNESCADSGIGAFLTAFFVLPSEERENLIPALNLIRSGTPGSFTIDESITDLIRALDSLCEVHGLSTQELLSRLDQDNQQRVTAIRAKAQEGLARIVSENKRCGRQEQADVLSAISGRVATVASKSRVFGIAVKDLLKHFELHDADVLDRYYATVPHQESSWAEILSAARVEVIHKGVLRIKDRSALRSWFWFARHLHDLCKRIILREVNYSGFYQASTSPWQGNHAVNRVIPAMTVKDLGFVEVPTQI